MMEQEAEKSDENSSKTNLTGETDVSSKWDKVTGELKNKEEGTVKSEACSPCSSETSNCDAKLLNDSNNSDTSLIKGFEGATVCDFDGGSHGRDGSQNDSAVASDISINNSLSTTPQASSGSSNAHTSTPLDPQDNDSGLHLDKSVMETNSSHLDIAKAISSPNCDSEIDVSTHLHGASMESREECSNSTSPESQPDDSPGHEASLPSRDDLPGQHDKGAEEAMGTEDTQESVKANETSSCKSGDKELKEGETCSSRKKTEVDSDAEAGKSESETTTASSATKSETSASSASAQENSGTAEGRRDSDPSVSDDVEADVDSVKRLRRRLRRRVLDSDTSSDSSDGDAGPGLLEKEDSDDNDDAPADDDNDDDRPIPKDPWRHVESLRQREFGFKAGMDASHFFRTRCGGSLGLVQRLECSAKLDHHRGCVNALHFNKTGTLLASGSDDLDIAVWNWMQDSPYFVFESGHRSNVFQCKFMPYTGDTHIASCARDGQVRLAELSSTGVCKGTKRLAQHKGAAHKLALLEDSSHELYSCGEDAVIYQIDLRESKPQKLCTAKEKERKVPLYSIHANPSKSFEFCTGGRDHFLRVYDKRMVSNEDGDCTVKKFCPHHLIDSDVKANVTCAVYNWNGTEVLGTYNDEDIYMFDNDMSEGAEYIHKYAGHRNNATVKGVNYYGPRSEYIVSGSDCGHVFLWERDTERIVNYFHADTGGVVNVLEPHPTMPMLATSGLDSDVKLWVPTAKEPTELKGLAKRVKKNRKERDDERSNEPDMLDGRMLWFLMHHLRRVRRGRPGGGAGDADDDDSDDDTNSEHDSDNESQHSDEGNPVECMPS